MTSKLTFRARTLDAAKPMAIHKAEELPELAAENAINRAVPALPTGMEKEEETEKHLQDILEAQTKGLVRRVAELVIPTPEVTEDHLDEYEATYNGQFKQPRQYIHVQPFNADQDLPDYDMDEEDFKFFNEELRERRKFEVSMITFEDMIDRLEKNSGQTVVSLKEAKMLLKEDDDLILAVYDYWLNKRLESQHCLIPTVKTEAKEGAAGSSVNPYIGFRRRTEKMQTRKNRKNDEDSYIRMLKLRRDLNRSVMLLEMVKRREKMKKERLALTADLFEKQFQAEDWDSALLQQVQVQMRDPVRKPLGTTTQPTPWENSPTGPTTPLKREKRAYRDGLAQSGEPTAAMELSDMGPDLSGGLESLARLELPSTTGSSFSPGGDFNTNPSHFSPTNHSSHFPTSDFPTPGEEFSPGGLSIQSQSGRKSEAGQTLSSPGHQTELLATAYQFCQAQEEIDLTIQCEDGELQAHQLVLAVASPFLKQLFQAERQRLAPGVPVVLVLPEVRASLVQALIHFLYTGTVVTQEGQFYSLMKLVYALNINASIEAESTKALPTIFRTSISPIKEEAGEECGLCCSSNKRRKRDSENNLLSVPSLNRPALAVNSLTASGVIVKEEMDEKPQVHESFSLGDGVMASGVTGPGTNQANNNQLGHFVSVEAGYQIKIEGTGQSIVPSTTAAGSRSTSLSTNTRAETARGSPSSDDPLAAIMNQTIFGGDSMGISFIQVSSDSFMAEPKSPEGGSKEPGTPNPDEEARLTDMEELPCVPDDDDLNISYNCEVCNRSIKGKVMMQAHKFQEHHENPDFEASNFPDDKFACRVCLKLFTRNSDVKAHILRVHCGDRRYPCTMCGKRFKESTHLRKHLYTHTGERPHYCALCSKGFQTSSDLKRHKKTRVHQERVEQGGSAAGESGGIDFSTDIDLDQELENSTSNGGGTPTSQFQSSPSFTSAAASLVFSSSSNTFSTSPSFPQPWEEETGGVSNLLVSGQTMTLHSGAQGSNSTQQLSVQQCSLPSTTLDLSDIKWGILEPAPLEKATSSRGEPEEEME